MVSEDRIFWLVFGLIHRTKCILCISLPHKGCAGCMQELVHSLFWHCADNTAPYRAAYLVSGNLAYASILADKRKVRDATQIIGEQTGMNLDDHGIPEPKRGLV